ncbi:MAG: molybdopterin biosynthesis protein [Firmicutes bacterium]|nr:molybdopterin biosynthesis protein [Bacillota bacterium]
MNKERNIYISNVDVYKAKKEYFNKLDIKNTYEEIDVLNSLNRITYTPVFAKNSSPHYNAAAMDGILVKAENTYGASESNPLVLVKGEDFLYINTGNPIVKPFNAVIMIEDVIEIESGKVKITKATYPWQHVRLIGEDIVKKEMIVPSNHKIRAIDLGALIAGGVEKVKVYKRPRVGILPTGSEIVENTKDLKKGKIIDSNTRVFKALINEYGGKANRYSPIDDKKDKLTSKIKKAVDENDILIINAGSSAGSKDFTVQVIRNLGEVFIHGVAMKPGKPTILGIIKGKPVIGLPGYPVSSYLSFETFVKPIINKYIGKMDDKNKKVTANISRRVSSSLKHKELLRVNLGYVNNKFIATPLTRGAGVTMSLVKADGIATIAKNSEGIEAKEEIKVNLLKPIEDIKETLVSIGSHDLILDIISDMIKFTSGHVGSMGGIMAMKRKESHIASIHLLDPDTGKYNIPLVKKYFKGEKMALIRGVKRLQGFIVKRNNPKNINGFNDLTRNDITFINRQRGSGTRVLLDYNLRNLKINPEKIKGYKREMSTHMSVAMAVKTNMVDTALGIKSAANAMDLDFISVDYENYDFLIPYESLKDERIKNFIKTIKSKEFKERINSLGGYKIENIGEVIRIGD